MGVTKIKNIKLDDTDWLEIFVTKLGKNYCVQFTNKLINVMVMNEKDGVEYKPLMRVKLNAKN
jgi:hypothetical protein